MYCWIISVIYDCCCFRWVRRCRSPLTTSKNTKLWLVHTGVDRRIRPYDASVDEIFEECIIINTLTRCDIAAMDQIIMRVIAPPRVGSVRMTCICDYLALPDVWYPVDTDTVRIKFARLLAFYQCRGISMTLPSITHWCKSMSNPLGRAVVVSQGCF